MVMSKVSKAIAASFLCLTINAGGATNAMNMEEQKTELNMLDVGNSSMAKSGNKTMKMKKLETNVVEIEGKEETERKETNGKKDDDNDDDNKDKKTDIWKILIPVFAGVGGLTVGICLGKFAF